MSQGRGERVIEAHRNPPGHCEREDKREGGRCAARQFAHRMIAGLSLRLHRLISDVEAYSLRSATQRLIGYLLRSDHEHEETPGQTLVTLPASKSVIASRLSITPERFSRVLHELTEARLIEVAGRSVTILDMEKLSSFEG